MEEDHIAGLIEAFETNDDPAARRHAIGLAYKTMNLMERLVAALEAIAENTAPVVVTGGLFGGGLGEN